MRNGLLATLAAAAVQTGCGGQGLKEKAFKGAQDALTAHPEVNVLSIVDAAVRLAAGDTLPAHYETPTIVITPDNFPQFYGSPEGHPMKIEAVRGLLAASRR